MVEFAALKRIFDRDGFVIVRSFLDRRELGELSDNLDRYIRTVVPGLPSADAFYDDPSRPETLKQLQHMGGDAYFQEYREHRRWAELASGLVGEAVVAKEPEWFNKPPGTIHVTPPHQDNFYFCLQPPRVVTLWLALDAIGEENGCLRYVRGSHQQGIRPHGATSVLGFSQGVLDYGPEDEACESPVCLEPGDVVAHHGNVIHRADANRTNDRQRRAFAMVMHGASCRRDEGAFDRYQLALQQQHSQLGLAK